MHNLEIQYNKRKEHFCIKHLHHIAISQAYRRCVTFWTLRTKWNCHGYLGHAEFPTAPHLLGEESMNAKEQNNYVLIEYIS